MKPHILDLREEGCPMALLLAKREASKLSGEELVIQIRDVSSMKDIVRYFDKQGISVQVEEVQQEFVLTVNYKRTQSNA